MNAKKWASAHVKDATLMEAVPVTVLTNILMLCDAPEESGFDLLGGGCYGNVYYHSLTPGVAYKVAKATHSRTMVFEGRTTAASVEPTMFSRTSADGYAVWATLCIEYQAQYGDMDFLPKFYKVQHSTGRSVYAMEALDDYIYADREAEAVAAAVAFAEAFADVLGAGLRYWGDPYEFDVAQASELQRFAAWLKARLPSDFESWDLHTGNVMLRGDCPVLTDPWSGVSPSGLPVSITRRLAASLGVSA